MNDKIYNEIINCIKNVLSYSFDNIEITLDTTFSDIGIDDLDIIEIIIECENHFNKSIDDNEWDWDIFNGTIKNFADFLISKL